MSLNDPTTPGLDEVSPSQTTKQTTITNSEELKGSFQERVNQLTRRASDAERVASATVSENSQLREQMNRLEQQIASLSARPQPTAPAPKGRALSEADMGANFEALTAQITQSVLGAVNPVLNEIKQRDANAELASKQQQSFLRAKAMHPELDNPDSDLLKTFATLWNGRQDLQKVEGSPELLVEAAKGLLSDARVNEETRKLAASTQVPRGTRKIDVLAEDASEIDNALESLSQTGAKEGWNSDEFGDYLTLKYKQASRGSA